MALIVDDDPDALAATVELFRMLGYRVCSAESGTKALQILRRTPEVEILYTDVLMPVMDGVTLARTAREFDPDIKVLLVSGFPDTVFQCHGGAPGEFDFLMKPVFLSEVAMALRR
jgi:CheY-like chemotaxis protein